MTPFMRVGGWLLLALPLVGGIELAAAEYFRHSAPSEADWELVEPRVKSLYQPGDWVSVAPAWAEPLLRHQLGASYFPVDLVGRPDNDGLRRAILLSFMGQEERVLWSWELRQTERFGPFTLRVYENPNPEPAKARLLDWVKPGRLEVLVGVPGDEKSCVYTERAPVITGGLGGSPTLPSARFTCAGGEPYVVAVTTIDDEHFEPRRCIFAHPSPAGPLTLTFHEVPLGKKLVGHGGLPWLISRDGAGTPVELTASVDGEHLGQKVFVDQEGFRRVEWNTRRFEGTSVELELVVTSKSSKNREFCFTLESR